MATTTDTREIVDMHNYMVSTWTAADGVTVHAVSAPNHNAAMAMVSTDAPVTDVREA